MTPKEKAKELVYKFQKHALGICEDPIQIHNAKQCALICVDEMISLYCIHNSDDIKVTIKTEQFDYWQEVKQEIEKL